MDAWRSSGTAVRAWARLLAVALTSVAGVAVTGALGFASRQPASVPPPLAARVDPYVSKVRVVVLTDIANEPDDQMSMVRFLV